VIVGLVGVHDRAAARWRSRRLMLGHLAALGRGDDGGSSISSVIVRKIGR
jgi:hypothetical protein